MLWLLLLNIALIDISTNEVKKRLELWRETFKLTGLKLSKTLSEYMLCQFNGMKYMKEKVISDSSSTLLLAIMIQGKK